MVNKIQKHFVNCLIAGAVAILPILGFILFVGFIESQIKMGIGGDANFQRNLDFIEDNMPSVNKFTNLTDYGVNVETATILGIMVPVTLDNATKRDMVDYLNGLSLGEE